MSGITIELTSGNELAEMVRELNDLGTSLSREISREVLPELERVLDRTLRTPAPARNRNIRFVWSTNPEANERARKWWFANNDGAYVRTGKIPNAWTAETSLRNGVVTMSIQNAEEGASYVYGSDTYNQIPGHRTTGWPNAADVLLGIFAEVEDDIDEAIDRTLEGL